MMPRKPRIRSIQEFLLIRGYSNVSAGYFRWVTENTRRPTSPCVRSDISSRSRHGVIDVGRETPAANCQDNHLLSNDHLIAAPSSSGIVQKRVVSRTAAFRGKS